MAVMFGGRLGTLATVVLIVGSLVCIAWTGALAARAAAHDSAEQARRDEAVLDALEPLVGLRR
ncbi:hypothetical protein AB0892_07985 [Streptomyces sp. NPDC005409]|uniref:hypothetical protein n=1 Tax=Streptomyces sp. NPDC005409 TaxID=3155342 RepID=UPI0034539A8A